MAGPAIPGGLPRREQTGRRLMRSTPASRPPRTASHSVFPVHDGVRMYPVLRVVEDLTWESSQMPRPRTHRHGRRCPHRGSNWVIKNGKSGTVYSWVKKSSVGAECLGASQGHEELHAAGSRDLSGLDLDTSSGPQGARTQLPVGLDSRGVMAGRLPIGGFRRGRAGRGHLRESV